MIDLIKQHPVLTAFCTLGLTLVLLSSSLMFFNQRLEIQDQAVKRGHAEYVVDSEGETTWQWKEEK